MAEKGLTRQSKLWAIGGGIIQDLATLSASLFKRGINWVYYPTTLTSMIDSCVGGKSSINTPNAKNIIGNIYPPEKVVVDTRFLASLPNQHLLSGLAEGVKICFAKGPEEFNSFVSNPASNFPADDDNTKHLIALSLTSKKWFVEKDEFDKNERKLLNFGHTFGHALEKATHYQAPHGIAVAFGMLAAIQFSGAKSGALSTQLETYLQALLEKWENTRLIEGEVDWQLFGRSLLADKKGDQANMLFIVPAANGSLVIQSAPRTDAGIREPIKTMERVLRGFA
jgi:3-dehydroquinate synthase